ncbi:ArsR/SmtB family transcription factor [Luteipulveratus mongoliensis]|uniref:ArsR family transcriptional regulator n=1 Tax=Luteipulveratus mongoliensis TaxID=571913 RepID=A0A0K1JKF1_9MICO|nr:metalloregulator ArsR/SmtB family transcription factor [Luteipulveratus mongoliensis]AKU17068.1 ArsR family transcriptional regulator [Luteipulveratus mongoliensis]
MQTAWEALGDQTRREIVQLLSREELTAGEIAGRFEISRPGVSRHLRVLREAGLVTARADAQRRVYSLDPAGIHGVEQWCAEVVGFWSQRLDALGTELARGRSTRGRHRRTTEPTAQSTQEDSA